MRLVLVAALLIGCQDEKNFPPLGGGGGGQGSGAGDAGAELDAGSDALMNLVTGKVCVIQNLRNLTSCDGPGDLSGITVQIGNTQAETDENGEFSIDLPAGTGLVWQVFELDFITTLQPFGSSTVIPAIRINDYNDLLQDNGIILTPGQGSVVVKVLDGTAPLVGATATASPAAQFQTRYDGTSVSVWDQDSTGALGLAWLPGIASATTTITVTPPSGSALTTTVPIQDGGITFATVAF